MTQTPRQQRQREIQLRAATSEIWGVIRTMHEKLKKNTGGDRFRSQMGMARQAISQYRHLGEFRRQRSVVHELKVRWGHNPDGALQHLEQNLQNV